MASVLVGNSEGGDCELSSTFQQQLNELPPAIGRRRRVRCEIERAAPPAVGRRDHQSATKCRSEHPDRGLAFYPVERRVVPSTENPGVLLISGTKQRVGSIDDESEGLTDAELAAANREAEKREKTVSGQDYRDTRQRPLLLIYFIRPKRKLEDVAAIDPTEFSEPLVALSLSFPRFNDAGSHQKAIYKVNVVEWRSRMASEMEPDGDVADEFDEAS